MWKILQVPHRQRLGQIRHLDAHSARSVINSNPSEIVLRFSEVVHVYAMRPEFCRYLSKIPVAKFQNGVALFRLECHPVLLFLDEKERDSGERNYQTREHDGRDAAAHGEQGLFRVRSVRRLYLGVRELAGLRLETSFIRHDLDGVLGEEDVRVGFEGASIPRDYELDRVLSVTRRLCPAIYCHADDRAQRAQHEKSFAAKIMPSRCTIEAEWLRRLVRRFARGTPLCQIIGMKLLLPVVVAFSFFVSVIACRDQISAPSAGSSAAPSATPSAGFGSADLARMKWIEGDWKGTGEVEKPFYERYRIEDGKGLVVESFDDESFTKAGETTRYDLKDGQITNSGNIRWGVAEVTDSAVRFVPIAGARNSFVFRRESADRWTATLEWPANGDKPARKVVYLMDRITKK